MDAWPAVSFPRKPFPVLGSSPASVSAQYRQLTQQSPPLSTGWLGLCYSHVLYLGTSATGVALCLLERGPALVCPLSGLHLPLLTAVFSVLALSEQTSE